METDLEAILKLIENGDEAISAGKATLANYRVEIAKTLALVALCDRLDRMTGGLGSDPKAASRALAVTTFDQRYARGKNG